MHSSFKVYLLTGTFYKGNGQLCQFNLSKFIYLFFNVKFLSFKKKSKIPLPSMCTSLGDRGQQVLVPMPTCAGILENPSNTPDEKLHGTSQHSGCSRMGVSPLLSFQQLSSLHEFLFETGLQNAHQLFETFRRQFQEAWLQFSRGCPVCTASLAPI